MSKDFVTGKILGGLGNQLFILFTTISYSIDNNLEYKIFLTEKKRKSYFDTPLYKNILNSKIEICRGKIYKEPFYHYCPISIHNKCKNIILDGYFQSWKYFHSNRERILKILDFHNLKTLIYEKYKNYIENDIVLHFRLGDYKNLERFHPICNIEYYIKSLKHFNEKSKVLYFFEKEDINVVENNINILKNIYPQMKFSPIDTKIDDWEQMIIMTGIKNNIISNSTFSWWGTYLSDLTDKKICYPEVWFGEALKDKNTKDLFFDSWNKIKY
jgi:hypothetical protein